MLKPILMLLLLLPALAWAGFPYPPKADDARVETYRVVGDVALRAWIFGDSDPAVAKPAIVFFFGGAWKGGSPAQFERQARHFARRGMLAITVDYRVLRRHGTPATACVEDGKAAIDWVRKHARRLGIDPDRIAAAGGSAGGHVAACTGTVSGFGADARPDAMILFNPACTLAPTEAWIPKGFGSDPQLDPLGTEAVAISPTHHVGGHTPPTLILHGEADVVVPIDSSRCFLAAMKQAQRRCQLIAYPDAHHGFFNRGEAYQQTLAAADRFLVDLGWLAEAE